MPALTQPKGMKRERNRTWVPRSQASGKVGLVPRSLWACGCLALACSGLIKVLEFQGGLNAASAKLETTTPLADLGTRVWGSGSGPSAPSAHLAHVELCIGVWEAGKLPGAAVEVHVAGPKGGEEAQVVIHCETQVEVGGSAQCGFLVLNPVTLRPEPILGPRFPSHASDATPVDV